MAYTGKKVYKHINRTDEATAKERIKTLQQTTMGLTYSDIEYLLT